MLPGCGTGAAGDMPAAALPEPDPGKQVLPADERPESAGRNGKSRHPETRRHPGGTRPGIAENHTKRAVIHDQGSF